MVLWTVNRCVSLFSCSNSGLLLFSLVFDINKLYSHIHTHLHHEQWWLSFLLLRLLRWPLQFSLSVIRDTTLMGWKPWKLNSMHTPADVIESSRNSSRSLLIEAKRSDQQRPPSLSTTIEVVHSIISSFVGDAKRNRSVKTSADARYQRCRTINKCIRPSFSFSVFLFLSLSLSLRCCVYYITGGSDSIVLVKLAIYSSS